MMSPHIDRAEAMRLINEIGMADGWLAITYSKKDNEIRLHSDQTKEVAYLVLSLYILKDSEFLDYILDKIKNQI